MSAKEGEGPRTEDTEGTGGEMRYFYELPGGRCS
jgi:hypothetical protein